MNGCIDEWTDDWKTDRWINGKIDEWTDEWMNGKIDEWTDEWMDRWMNG